MFVEGVQLRTHDPKRTHDLEHKPQRCLRVQRFKNYKSGALCIGFAASIRRPTQQRVALARGSAMRSIGLIANMQLEQSPRQYDLADSEQHNCQHNVSQGKCEEALAYHGRQQRLGDLLEAKRPAARG